MNARTFSYDVCSVKYTGQMTQVGQSAEIIGGGVADKPIEVVCIGWNVALQSLLDHKNL